MSMKYAGIGYISTPEKVREQMTTIGSQLAEMGFVLRSGNTIGAEQAWEELVPENKKEIMVPQTKPNCPHGIVPDFIMEQSEFVIEHYHKTYSDSFHKNNAYVQYLHLRNLNILYGKDLNDPVDFVVYWNAGDSLMGNVAHIVSMANELKIPCFNIWNQEDQQAMDEFVNQLMEKN